VEERRPALTWKIRYIEVIMMAGGHVRVIQCPVRSMQLSLLIQFTHQGKDRVVMEFTTSAITPQAIRPAYGLESVHSRPKVSLLVLL
jgi:hypothetical protein